MERYGLHFARPADAEQLLERGFSSDARTIQAWAAGVYLATDRESAALYDDGEREALVVRAHAKRPFLIELPEKTGTIFDEVERVLRESFGELEAALVNATRLRAERLSLAGELARILRAEGFDALEIRVPWPVNRDDIRSIHFGGNQLVVFDPAQVQVLGVDAGLALPQSGRPEISDLDARQDTPARGVPGGTPSVDLVV